MRPAAVSPVVEVPQGNLLVMCLHQRCWAQEEEEDIRVAEAV